MKNLIQKYTKYVVQHNFGAEKCIAITHFNTFNESKRISKQSLTFPMAIPKDSAEIMWGIIWPHR